MKHYDVPFKTVDGDVIVDNELWDILLEYNNDYQVHEDIPFSIASGKPQVDMEYWDMLNEYENSSAVIDNRVNKVLQDILKEKEEEQKERELIASITPKIEPQSEKIVPPSIGEAFKKRVLAIWSDCVVKTPKAWKNSNHIIGDALDNDYCYYSDKLLEHQDEIKRLLYLVNHATNYEDLKFLNNGEEWTKLRQHVGFLMSLGQALGYIKFQNAKLSWEPNEEKNPGVEITLTRNRK